MEAVGALGALLSTKKNQGDQARASLLASCKKKKEGMCMMLRDDPLSKVTETLGGSWGCDRKVGWAGRNWVEGAKRELGGPHPLHWLPLSGYMAGPALPLGVSPGLLRGLPQSSVSSEGTHLPCFLGWESKVWLRERPYPRNQAGGRVLRMMSSKRVSL